MKTYKNLMFLSVFILCYCLKSSAEENDDFYKLLGVPRDATTKEIRKAFKNLAVKLHPDKNQDDEEADQKFIKIARAYETLKDPDTRKHYDVHGDAGSSDKKQQYHSYTYYRDQFGIYDDDPLIVTLSRADYEVNILDDSQAWFVNFYSPNCHHCHELAPTWRKLASDLEGVVRIAAVNCEDDWSLCYQLSIESYPTLLYYEKQAHLHEGQRYRGPRTFDRLKDYVLSQLTVDVKDITTESWSDGDSHKQWLLFLCSEDGFDCPEHETRLKMAAILDGLMSVGLVTSPQLCDQVSESHKINPVVLWQPDDKVHKIAGSDSKEILESVLNILPNPPSLDEQQFQEIRANLRNGNEKPWLLCFYLGTATDLNLQLKRLPGLIPSINIGLIHCGKNSPLCSSLHISRYPSWAVLKVGGAFELHHGRDVLHEVSAFARDSAKSTNLHALSPADIANIMNEDSAWFVDWYAPWCPPCRKLMPELRRASQHFDPEQIQFGTVDCTLHRQLCSQHGIGSYPTTILYNGTRTQRFHGVPNEDGIVEFVNDMLTPSVISLDESSFGLLMRKPEDELWVVDFFAPWCGPCQRLGPEWRKLAKQVAEFSEVKVAQVDCVANSEICSAQNVRSYPTIRLYPLGSRGLNTVAMYNGNRDVVSMKRWVLSLLPSPVISMNAEMFRDQILAKQSVLPWLVEFYAPWCGHCTHFEPEFMKVANRLEGYIRSVKVDCEAERVFCATLYINSYPSLFLYLSPTERHEISTQSAKEIVSRVKQIVNDRHSKHDEL
ncbi:hypothetical protein Zmor_022007 [Zophobas morio]|uniref:DnaJ homolog subfamily C member 10 n=1 Tax=Zophobas morio TaxID=2755281 RepID=A0AA38I6Z5_9CUCU|nr:hypothetical protein Zmor_022007 [Zophobas morio]